MNLGRAKEHLDQLKVEVGRFLGNRPFTVSEYDDLDHALHIVTLESKVMPDAIGLLVGEFAYCLRSGLDHLARNLSLLTTQTPASNTQFPIHSHFTKDSQRRFVRQTRDIPAAPLKIIKSLQPHQSRAAFQGNPLWQLDKLCNIDKHRVIAYSHTALAYTFSVPGQKRDTEYGFEIAIALADKHNFQFYPSMPEAVFGEPLGTPGGFEIRLDGLSRI